MSAYTPHGANTARSPSFNDANTSPLRSAGHPSHDFHQYFPRNPSVGLQRNASVTSQSSLARFVNEWVLAQPLVTPSFSTPTQSTFPPPTPGTAIGSPTPLAGRGQYPPLLGDSSPGSLTERWLAAFQRPEVDQVGLPSWPISRQASLAVKQFDLAGIQAMCKSLFVETDMENGEDDEFQRMAEEEEAVELSLLRDVARTAGEDPFIANAPLSSASSVASFVTSVCSTEDGQATAPATPCTSSYPLHLFGTAIHPPSLLAPPLTYGSSLVAAFSTINAEHPTASRRPSIAYQTNSQYPHVLGGSACDAATPASTGHAAVDTDFVCRWKDLFSPLQCGHQCSTASLLAHHLCQVHGRQELRYLSEGRLRQDDCSALILSTVFKLLRGHLMVAISHTVQIQALLVLHTMSSAQHVDLGDNHELVEELSRTGPELENQLSQ